MASAGLEGLTCYLVILKKSLFKKEIDRTTCWNNLKFLYCSNYLCKLKAIMIDE